jgi:glycosyltransferase involved in cell wall biosynthesis
VLLQPSLCDKFVTMVHHPRWKLSRKISRMTDISIIIPTLNRASHLGRALQSIATGVSPTNTVEITVVDNGSTDQTASVYQETKEQFPKYEWRYFDEPMPGLLSGRHRGAKEARGEILSFLDDDVLLSASWFNALQDAFSDPGIVLVGGPSRPQYELDPPDWLERLWVEVDGFRILGSLSLLASGPEIRIIDPLYVFGLNFSIRKAAFETCGGFHPDCIQATLQRYQGDGETGLSLKVKEAGFRALHHPDLAVTHLIPASRLSLESFERRGFYQGVCDSYTEIRRNQGLSSTPLHSWRDLVRPAKRKVERELILRRPSAEGVRRLMALSHFAGVQFHRNEVRNDPKLLEWVLRQNYFDYSLPDGWEQYLDAAPSPSRSTKTWSDQIARRNGSTCTGKILRN